MGAHQVRDVKALNDARRGGETEQVGQLGEALLGGGAFEGGDEAGLGALAGELLEGQPGVAQTGGALVILALGGGFHLFAHLVNEGRALAAQEGAGFVEARAVVRLGDAPEAGGRAEADDVVEAVGVVLRARVPSGALAQTKAALGEVDGHPHDG